MNESRAAVFVAVLSLIAAESGFAQTRLTLREAVSMALRHDARVAEAETREQSAGRDADVAHAHFGPSIFTGTGAMYTYGFPQVAGGAPPSVFNLAFTQTLFDGPAKGRERAAERRVDVQKLTAAQVRAGVIAETAIAYVELVSVRRALDEQRRARESAQRIVDLAGERMKEGRALPIDVLQARLAAARLGQRLAELEGRQIVLEGQLHVLTGVPSGPALRVEVEDLPSVPERSIEELVATAFAASPDLKAAQLERQAREQALEGERAGFWPSFDLVGNYAVYSRFNNLDTFFTRFQRNSVNVGVEARVPVFASGTSASVALARTQVLQADAMIRRQQDQIDLDVRRAAEQARVGAGARQVAELELAVAQEHVRVAEARVAEGRADRADVEQARVEAGRAWDAFYQAEFERQRGQLKLRLATGELTQLFP